MHEANSSPGPHHEVLTAEFGSYPAEAMRKGPGETT